MTVGRQIFLRGREIDQLARLVDAELYDLDILREEAIDRLDEEAVLTDPERLKMWQEIKDQRESEMRLMRGIRRKLWYYA